MNLAVQNTFIRMEISTSDRQKASRIIADLRRDYSCGKIAEMIGIKLIYVSYAQGMYKHRNKVSDTYVFLCPKKAIAKILEVGALLGARRIKIP